MMIMFTAAVLVMVVIVVMMVMMAVVVMTAAFGTYGSFVNQLLQFVFQCVFLFQNLQDLSTGQLFPGGGENVSGRIVFSEQFHTGRQLGIGYAGGMAQDDGTGIFDLVVEEFTEVLHVHLALVYIRYRGKSTQLDVGGINVRNGFDHIAEFADPGRLDQDPVGGIFCDDLLQSFRKISDQTAADTAGVHFGDVHACILQETAVDPDVAEFVFDQHQFFAAVGFCDQFFDQGCLTGSQETGKYINSCHK